jgi:hypothetical protein
MALYNYPNLNRISVSKYARRRLSSRLMFIINSHRIMVEVSDRNVGRPSLIERYRR